MYLKSMAFDIKIQDRRTLVGNEVTLAKKQAVKNLNAILSGVYVPPHGITIPNFFHGNLYYYSTAIVELFNELLNPKGWIAIFDSGAESEKLHIADLTISPFGK